MAKRMNFTKANCERATCPADKARVMIYDAKQPGLCLQVTSNGGKSFYLYRKIDGRPEKLFLGKLDDITPEQARDKAARRKGEIASDRNPAEEKRQRRAEITLADAFKRYIDEYAKVHKRSWEGDQDQFDLHCDSIKSRRLSDIRRSDIQALHTKIGESHKYAANRLLALLSKVYSEAANLVGYGGPNPCKGVKRFKELSRERFLQPDEMPRFLAALDVAPDWNMADFFRLCLFTGARRSNIQAMKWADVNFSRRVWTIPADEAKAGDTLNVYLSEVVITILQKRWKARQPDAVYVFPGWGANGHIVEPKAAWKWICKKAGITGLRIHDLRRSLGSWMTAGNASTAIVGKTLGQKSQQATAIYARLNLTPVAAAVEQAIAAMQSATAEEGGAKKNKSA